MSNFLTIPLFIFAAYSYLFSFWKALREEAPQSSLFTSELVILLCGIVFGIIGLSISPLVASRTIFDPSHVWFQIAFIGLVLGLAVVSRSINLSFALLSEAVTPGVLVMLLVLSIPNLANVALVAVALVIFFILHKTYKQIGWYKSGRPGFAAYAAFGLLFLARIVFALMGHPMLFSIGQVDILFSTIISFLCFFLIYNQSGL